MFNNLIGKNKELGRFLFCERYTLPPVKNAMYIAEGQELKRGAVVDVNGVLVGTNSLMPYAVLEFDCDTRDEGKQASVFTKGEFNFDKLHFASGLSKSDMDNIVYNGNAIGIVIKPYEYDEGFEPIMSPSASKENPLMTAEETERMIDAMKPIDALTLRFEFSKKAYNPDTAGVGSAGTWTKVDSPTLNVWDWTTDATDWTSAFQGAFTDTDNEVRVIAAGDTSSVTKMEKLFAGVYSGSPIGTYSVTARNNVVKCVAFDVSNMTKMNSMFTANNLNSVVYFDFSNNNSNCECDYLFADTLIEEVGDISIKAKYLTGIFAKCGMLKRVGTLTIDENVHSPSSNTSFFSKCGQLKEIEGLVGTSTIQKFQSMFFQCRQLEKIGGSLDLSSAKTINSCFGGCWSLEKLPEFVGSSNSLTDAASAFNSCYKIPEVPLFDTSNVKTANSMISYCREITKIPDYDFSSVTNVNYFANSCYKVKEGILETYDKFLDRGASITDHTDCFTNCGIDTEEGRAALAQIPASWGGLA